jgi:hypothetical protein
MAIIRKPPQVVVHHIDDCEGPPFLKVRHLKCKLKYPNGDISEEFLHDVVERKSLDACVMRKEARKPLPAVGWSREKW